MVPVGASLIFVILGSKYFGHTLDGVESVWDQNSLIQVLPKCEDSAYALNDWHSCKALYRSINWLTLVIPIVSVFCLPAIVKGSHTKANLGGGMFLILVVALIAPWLMTSNIQASLYFDFILIIVLIFIQVILINLWTKFSI